MSQRRASVRFWVVVTLALFALGALAVPASAAKPTKPGGGGAGGGGGTVGTTTSMTLSPSAWVTNNTCAFDATYTWAGLKGRGYTLAVKLLDSSGNVLATPPQVNFSVASGDFTFIFSFNGAPGPQRNISVRGVLLSGGVEVSGTAQTSAVLPTTCGNPISIGWVQTIPLT
jgi:hypothetical protein